MCLWEAAGEFHLNPWTSFGFICGSAFKDTTANSFH